MDVLTTRTTTVLMLVSLIALITARNVTINLLDTAVSKGAVCLDGTPPAYAYRQGYGDGADKWIVYLQGGGWCVSTLDCLNRSKSELGSSTQILNVYDNQFSFDGMLDDNATFNPDFYNWNIFHIFYCDGSSFMSNVEQVNNITYTGARIFDAMMEELLLNKGMGNAKHAILSGGSAGGLATILHCDKFGALFPKITTKVKCISDSGFFIHGEHFRGADRREQIFFSVVSTHGLDNTLPTSCTEKLSPTLCLFPEYLIQDIQTPLFLIESAFDKFQIGENIYSYYEVHHDPELSKCIDDLKFCNWTHFKIMKDFRSTFIETLRSSIAIEESSRIGYFVHSCYVHGHITLKEGWTCSSLVGSNILAKKTIGQAVSDWYFNRVSLFQEIDMINDLPRVCYNNLTVPEFEKKCSAVCTHLKMLITS